jgi:hypothetical protein
VAVGATAPVRCGGAGPLSFTPWPQNTAPIEKLKTVEFNEFILTNTGANKRFIPSGN